MKSWLIGNESFKILKKKTFKEESNLRNLDKSIQMLANLDKKGFCGNYIRLIYVKGKILKMWINIEKLWEKGWGKYYEKLMKVFKV